MGQWSFKKLLNGNSTYKCGTRSSTVGLGNAPQPEGRGFDPSARTMAPGVASFV